MQPVGRDADPAKYKVADSLTREMLVELVKEIRVSGTDTIEIQGNQ